MDGNEKAAEPLASCLPKLWGVFECVQRRMSLPGVVLGYGITIWARVRSGIAGCSN